MSTLIHSNSGLTDQEALELAIVLSVSSPHGSAAVHAASAPASAAARGRFTDQEALELAIALSASTPHGSAARAAPSPFPVAPLPKAKPPARMQRPKSHTADAAATVAAAAARRSEAAKKGWETRRRNQEAADRRLAEELRDSDREHESRVSRLAVNAERSRPSYRRARDGARRDASTDASTARVSDMFPGMGSSPLPDRAWEQHPARYQIRAAHQADAMFGVLSRLDLSPAYHSTGRTQQIRDYGGYQGGDRELIQGPRGGVFHLSGGGGRVYHGDNSFYSSSMGGGGSGGPTCGDGSLDMRFACNRGLDKYG